MDKLIEAINFASNSYWGDPSKFQFKTRIDSFTNQIILESGSDRTIKSTFDMVLNGYLVPDSVNRELASINRTFAPTQIIFGLEVADSEQQFQANIDKKKMKRLSSVLAADSTNVLVQNITGVPQELLNYINTNIQEIGIFINETTISFNKTLLVAPPGFPPTSIDNFTFFCNGMVIEKSAIESFTETSTESTLIINLELLGYGFSNTDEVVGIGKFST
jgi:hypothetical protein